MPRHRTIPLVVVAFLLIACRDQRLPTSADGTPPVLASSRAALTSATDGSLARTLHLLPPLAKRVPIEGRFDASLLPALRVEVCEWTSSGCGSVVAGFTSAGHGGEALRLEREEIEFYHVVWNTLGSSLDPAKSYRLRVLLGSRELGGAAVKVGRNARELQGLDESVVGIVLGQSVPVNFWVSRERLRGAPGEPASTATPELRYVSRAEDFSRTHPELPGVRISFNTLGLLLRPGTTVAQANAVLDAFDATVVGARPGSGSISGLLVVRLPTRTHLELISVLERLRQHPHVAHAVPDIEARGEMLPRVQDQAGSWTWELVPEGGNWGLELIRAPQMWNLNPALRRTGAAAPLTGILDEGFADAHDDLEYTVNLTPGIEDDHGTHVAGIIGARFDNGAGVEGVNPFASMVVAAVPDSTSWLTILFELEDLIRSYPDLRVINMSLGFAWEGPPVIDTNTNLSAQQTAAAEGALFLSRLQVLEQQLGSLPVIVAAAGNESNLGVGNQPAKFASPMNYAALELNAANILVVESLANAPLWEGGATRSDFSNPGGHLSAPGSDVLSTVLDPVEYDHMDGTSMAAPHVAGLLGYLATLDPGLTASLSANPLGGLLRQTAKPVSGTSARRIDAIAAALDLDRLRGNDRVLRMLLDIDDGTLDGNHRTHDDGSDYTAGNDGVGDGRVDMRDFRRWRDWLLQVDALPELDGSAQHPKKDVNGDGLVGTAAQENVYPRGDFNGDGILSREATSRVPGVMNNQEVTDLQVLQRLFEDPHYSAEDLPGLILSADLEVRAQSCLAVPGAVRAHTVLRVRGSDAVFTSRTHDVATPVHLYTVPVRTQGYTARLEALDEEGSVVGSADADFPLVLGSDTRWTPECRNNDIEVLSAMCLAHALAGANSDWYGPGGQEDRPRDFQEDLRHTSCGQTWDEQTTAEASVSGRGGPASGQASTRFSFRQSVEQGTGRLRVDTEGSSSAFAAATINPAGGFRVAGAGLGDGSLVLDLLVSNRDHLLELSGLFTIEADCENAWAGGFLVGVFLPAGPPVLNPVSMGGYPGTPIEKEEVGTCESQSAAPSLSVRLEHGRQYRIVVRAFTDAYAEQFNPETGNRSSLHAADVSWMVSFTLHPAPTQ